METTKEQELLERYALLSKQKVISSQADLDPKDTAMPQMLSWCRQQQGIVVLRSGVILSSQPSTRTVQNCKIVMMNKGLRPGRMMAATSNLIQMVLDNGQEEINNKTKTNSPYVSIQQQRLRTLVKEAITVDASDIHIEVRQDMAQIRFRKHGEMYLHAEWLAQLGREIASVAFNKETDHASTHFNPLVPQQASMALDINGKPVRLRLASLPAHGGFDMVLRILAIDDNEVSSLEMLGYSSTQIRLIKKAIAMPHGAVIVSGPTGSGKTTTLAACISMVPKERKVYTIEDPIEKVVPTATQVPVNTEQSDRTFASMGRSALRMDPDVIVLGEMRDEDTAHVMLRAAITGHLVFSTLHTNTAPGIITRLIDMRISPTLLADSNVLTCLICQRLIVKLCSECSISLKESPLHQTHIIHWQHLFSANELQNMRARGNHYCNKCHGLGISGRTVVAEIIWIDDQSRQYIQKQDILGWEKYLKANGWVTYRDQAIQLVKNGIVDPLDAEKILGELM